MKKKSNPLKYESICRIVEIAEEGWEGYEDIGVEAIGKVILI